MYKWLWGWAINSNKPRHSEPNFQNTLPTCTQTLHSCTSFPATSASVLCLICYFTALHDKVHVDVGAVEEDLSTLPFQPKIAVPNA